MGFLPSVSLGWRLSEENFMQAYKERVGDLKLRTSFGILGNQSIGTYDRFTVYELYNNSYAYNNQTVSGAGFKLGKDNLTWEKTKTFNVGVDASFFNNALNVTFDYFYKRTSDILMKPLCLRYSVRIWRWTTLVRCRIKVGTSLSTIV